MRKIQRNKLFIQVRYNDLLRKLWLIFLFKANCEVYISPDEIDCYDARKVERAARLLKARGVLRRVHAPVCDPNKEGFDKYKEVYYKTARFARCLGADTIIMHAEGYWPGEHMHIWNEIAALAEKDSIKVLLENHQENSAKAVVKILTTVNSANLKACFDIGHFQVFGEKEAVLFLNDYPKGMIEEVHLSDNLGKEDSHLPLGKGRIKFPDLFNALDAVSPDPYYTIEATDLAGVINGMLYLRRVGRL